MDYKLPKTMKQDIEAIKKKGQRPRLIRAGDALATGNGVLNTFTCENCNGVGNLVLEYFTGGPSQSPIPTNVVEFKETTTYYDGAWYKRRLKQYTCPVCNGLGKEGAE